MGANRGRLVGAGLVVVVGLAAGGCEVSAGGMPWSGSESSVSLEWTVNGLAASADVCNRAGSASVVLWASVVDPGCGPGTEDCGDTLDTWVWDCASGTADSGLEFRAGPVWLTWGITAADGRLREATRWQVANLHAGNNGFTFDFTPGWSGTPDATLVGSWTLGGQPASTATCTAAGAENVRLSYRLPGGGATTTQWPCAAGTGSTGSIFRTFQRYELMWELLDATDAAIAVVPATGWQTQTMATGDNPVALDFPVGGALDVTLEWADKTASPAWGACDLPPDPVAELGYRLEDATSGDVLEEVDLATAPIACTGSLAFTGLPLATYRLIVDGRAASPATATWHAECTGLEVDAVTGATATCQVAMTTP